MDQQISIAFHLLVLASVASGRGVHHNGRHHHSMARFLMPFPDTTGVSIALPPTASSPAPQQEPQYFAMPPQVKDILESPSPAPSHVDAVDEGSVFAGIVKSLGSPDSSPAKDMIGKALDALGPMEGQAKEELEKQGAKMAADHILESLAPSESSDGAIKDVLDKVGGIGGASDAISDVISSSGTDVNDLISQALNTDSPSTTSDDASTTTTTTTTSDLEQIIAAAAASQDGHDETQENDSGSFTMRRSSMAGTIAIVAVTACFMS